MKINTPVEIIVVLNRCSDKTEALANKYNAITVEENEKNIAKIRNVGVKASTGDVLVTIDADSWMTPNMLQEVVFKLKTGRYVGGGVRIKPERLSLGIICSVLMIAPYMLKARISAGMFWLYKHHFEALGGFDESQQGFAVEIGGGPAAACAVGDSIINKEEILGCPHRAQEGQVGVEIFLVVFPVVHEFAASKIVDER